MIVYSNHKVWFTLSVIVSESNMHHCRHEWGQKGIVIFWDDHSWFVGVFYWSSSHWNHSDISVIDLEVLIMAHAPFPPYLETELMYSGPVRVFSMIHRVTEKRTVCSCCGHWVCVWWLVMAMRPRLTDCAGQKLLQTDRWWPDTTMTGQVRFV